MKDATINNAQVSLCCLDLGSRVAQLGQPVDLFCCESLKLISMIVLPLAVHKGSFSSHPPHHLCAVLFCFEMGSHYIALIGLELTT